VRRITTRSRRTGELVRGEHARQLDEGERVAPGELDEPAGAPLARLAVIRAPFGQQLGRSHDVQATDRELGHPGGREDERPTAAGREDQRDGFGGQPAGDEQQHARRRRVGPVRVVDQAQQALVGGGLGEQGEHGQRDQECIRVAGPVPADRPGGERGHGVGQRAGHLHRADR